MIAVVCEFRNKRYKGIANLSKIIEDKHERSGTRLKIGYEVLHRVVTEPIFF
jgi:hypothetical protein